VVGQISATYSVTTHCLRSILQEQCSASSPFGNCGYSADLQNSLALVHHLGIVLETLETLSACPYFGDHCYINRHRTVFCRCPVWKSLLYWILNKQLSASVSFGSHLKYWKSKRCSLSLLTSQQHRVCPCSDVWWWDLKRRNKWNAARTTCQHLCCVGVNFYAVWRVSYFLDEVQYLNWIFSLMTLNCGLWCQVDSLP